MPARKSVEKALRPAMEVMLIDMFQQDGRHTRQDIIGATRAKYPKLIREQADQLIDAQIGSIGVSILKGMSVGQLGEDRQLRLPLFMDGAKLPMVISVPCTEAKRRKKGCDLEWVVFRIATGQDIKSNVAMRQQGIFADQEKLDEFSAACAPLMPLLEAYPTMTVEEALCILREREQKGH